MKTPSTPRYVALGLLPILLVGCGGASGDGYTFALTPRLIEGQSPFANSPDVKLLIKHATGENEIFLLGTAGSGDTVELSDLPDIAAGSTVGIIAETAGGAPDQYDPAELVAYGQVLLETDLITSEDNTSLEIFMPQAGAVGELGTLPAKFATVGAGVAMVPGGDVFIFGGSENAYQSAGTNRILRMSNTDSDDWDFEKLDITMPNVDVDSKLTGLTATTVMVDGEALIFVAGGRPGTEDQGGIGSNSMGSFLFDPVSEEVVSTQTKMTEGRSGHRAVLLDNGKVLLYGGWQGFSGQTRPGSYDLFDPEKEKFTFDLTDGGDYSPAAASLGSNGAMICGGIDATDYSQVATCVEISPSGDIGGADDLPEAVFGLAMVALGDGKILATGGVSAPTDFQQASPAIKTAWLYNGNKWSELDSQMELARAHHMMIPTPEGKIVIVGGVENGAFLFPPDGPAVLRSEVFDPETLEFELLGGSLSDAGAGALARYAAYPGEGALVFAGYDESVGGETISPTYAFIGFGPDGL